MTTIIEKPFGRMPQGEPVTLYTFRNAYGSEIDVSSYGGAIVSIRVPDRDGNPADVVLGHETLEGYRTRSGFLGVAVGRCANRIAGGRFTLNGKEYRLNCNTGNHHLHGGNVGFDAKVWDGAVRQSADGPVLELTLDSPDGEENYPGNLRAVITYAFTDENELKIHYHAVSDADTLCNLTNHSYFNLAGHDSGNILGHELKIYASRFTQSDAENIPTGRILDVAGTPMDFRDYHAVGERIGADYDQLKNSGGYDHNFNLDKPKGELGLCAEVYEPKSGRTMQCLTTSPCVQLYCANFLSNVPDSKGGAAYGRYNGLCLETQFAPDAVNHPEWDGPVLRAGEAFDQTTVYRFGVR